MKDDSILLIITLFAVFVSVWLAVYLYPDRNLKVVMCDVGQGDAIVVVYGKTQILIDGGPDTKVLRCLDEHMPYWDRKIEMVLLTHPQTDHFVGLIEVVKRYEVEVFLATSLDSGTQEYKVLKSVVGGSGVRVINPTRGMVIRSGLIYLDILHPSNEYLEKQTVRKHVDMKASKLGMLETRRDPNDLSIVAVLRYKDFDALMTGDIGTEVSDMLAKEGVLGEVEYIKIPHHGSKNGITKKLLEHAKPEIAAISAGKNNSYGHPHNEVVNMLQEKGVLIIRTDMDGDVVVITDGTVYWVEE